MKALLSGIFAVLFAIGFVTQAHAKTAEQLLASAGKSGHVAGFVKLATGNELYIDYILPAPGKPIAVLLNGLTYRTGIWDRFVAELQGDGLGILRYDMQGQGETLLKYAPITNVIPLQTEVTDLKNLLDVLQITQPVHLISLSYGGAVAVPFAAQNPTRVATVNLMAPFVAPIPSTDDWVKNQVVENRLEFPANPASDDQLYDYFLHLMIFETYPLLEPIVLENPYKLEAIFRIVEGARDYFAKDFVNQLPAGKVHLVVARNDQYVPAQQHEDFWQSLPAQVRASRLFIEDSEHKIPEAVPSFSAAWARMIIEGDSRLTGGVTFEGSPYEHKATAGSLVIQPLGE